MRQVVIDEVYNLMKENKDAYFIVGDLGFHSVEKIEKDFPKRFINAGVAEQNMIGIAAGLALSGKKVYVYSIIPFITMRCYEQIRNDICYNNTNVTLLGAGAGLTYGILSSTHFALEDIAILRPLPNMSIFTPADDLEGKIGIRKLKNYKKPLYVRLGARTEPAVFTKPYYFEFGKGKVIQKGMDITIFSYGSLISEVIKAVKLLKEKNGITATIVNFNSLKPLDKEIIIKHSKNKKIVFTVEEHFKIGGLGSAVSEILSQQPGMPMLKIIGVEDKFIKVVGTRSYLRSQVGLDSKGIYRQIVQQLMKK